MYEQDEANVFAEPSVMAEQLLPYLLRIVDRYADCPLLVQSLTAWAQENVGPVLDGLAASKELAPGTKLGFSSKAAASRSLYPLRLDPIGSYARSMIIIINNKDDNNNNNNTRARQCD